ncbi:hypothetical protein DO021_19160 [Desulfobacter hydrogenophilus]|uniref:Uncharacterized protein n=1 Tax=Desulfobacter hydrogenophilus TaxID=2291 RepID=A0A328FAF6_9BACT|nr:hypothetical protein DO021_19160 [Desulfobacter hydrogenophilus]
MGLKFYNLDEIACLWVHLLCCIKGPIGMHFLGAIEPLMRHYRTTEQGYHINACPNGGYEVLVHNFCKDKSCPNAVNMWAVISAGALSQKDGLLIMTQQKSYPFEYMPWSKTKVMSPSLVIAFRDLMPSVNTKTSVFPARLFRYTVYPNRPSQPMAVIKKKHMHH